MERAVVHSSTFSTQPAGDGRRAGNAAAFDEENIVEHAPSNRRRCVRGAWRRSSTSTSILHEVRGLGLMIGLEFGEPSSIAPRLRYRAVEAMRNAMFSQLIVVPLFHRHRILTQVAGDNVNIVKLLPPLIAGQEESRLLRRCP